MYHGIKSLTSQPRRSLLWTGEKKKKLSLFHCVAGNFLIMSPTDAKRGAKRRKNKRGGASSTAGKSEASAAARAAHSAATAASTRSFLTTGSSGNVDSGLNGEVNDTNLQVVITCQSSNRLF